MSQCNGGGQKISPKAHGIFLISSGFIACLVLLFTVCFQRSRIQNLMIRIRQKNKYKKVKVEDDFDERLEEDGTPTVGSPASIKQRKAEEGRQGGVEMI